MRTPVGRYGGALSDVRPDDLAAIVIAEAVSRAGVDAAEIEDVYFGAANQAGEDNRNVARMAVLLAGLPESVAGVTVNRLCASGLAAVVAASHAVAAGDGDLFVAGGVESMSRAPLVLGKPEHAFPRGNQTVYDTTLGWRFPNPKMEEMFPLESMGETGENVAERYGVSREDQDAFALQSQQRWAAANEAGRFDDELVAVGDVTRDEHPRPDTNAEKLAALKPAFRRDGSVTAGNSSGINDGAAALVIASEERAAELGIEPLGAFVGSAVAGVDPRIMGIGPIPAVRKLLDRAGVGVEDLDLVELNEAFASQSLAVIRELGLDPDEGERERRRDRARPSAGNERRAPRRHAPARAAPPRRPLRAGDAVRRRRPGQAACSSAEVAARPDCTASSQSRIPRVGNPRLRSQWGGGWWPPRMSCADLTDGRAHVDDALVLDRDEGRAERHDHSLDPLVDLALLTGANLDLDLADRLRIQPCVLELLQEPVAVGDPRCLDVDGVGHRRILSGRARENFSRALRQSATEGVTALRRYRFLRARSRTGRC